MGAFNPSGVVSKFPAGRFQFDADVIFKGHDWHKVEDVDFRGLVTLEDLRGGLFLNCTFNRVVSLGGLNTLHTMFLHCRMQQGFSLWGGTSCAFEHCYFNAAPLTALGHDGLVLNSCIFDGTETFVTCDGETWLLGGYIDATNLGTKPAVKSEANNRLVIVGARGMTASHVSMAGNRNYLTFIGGNTLPPGGSLSPIT